MQKPEASNLYRSLTNLELSLGLLGLLPFVYTALLLPLPWGLVPERAFIVYSCVILAFLAGSLWQGAGWSSLVSNGFALAVVLLLVLPLQTDTTLTSLMLMYLLLLAWELKVCRAHYAMGYQYLRCGLTLVVALCHGWLISL